MLERETEHILIFESGKKAFGLELDRVDSIVEKNRLLLFLMRLRLQRVLYFTGTGCSLFLTF